MFRKRELHLLRGTAQVPSGQWEAVEEQSPQGRPEVYRRAAGMFHRKYNFV